MSLDEDNTSWYWGKCNPEQVDGYLADCHDGTFVVYDTHETEELTLAYRVNGRTKLVRMLHRENLYGFTEPLGFDTLESALDAYNWSPTETGNTLIFPGVRPDRISRKSVRHSLKPTDHVLLLRQIKHNAKVLEDKDIELEKLARQTALHEQKLYELTCLIESLKRLLNTLDAQMKKHHEVSRGKATTADVAKAFSDNFIRLTARIHDISTELDQNEAERAKVEHEYVSVCKRSSELSSEMQGMKRDIIETKRILVQSNPGSDVFIVNLLSKHSVRPVDVIVPQRVDNSNAKRSLKSQEDGTFIARLNSADSDTPFVVSVCQSGTVYHFPVYKIDGCFGFDSITCVFDSLQELIEHYMTVPFRIHDEKYWNLYLNKQLLLVKK